MGKDALVPQRDDERMMADADLRSTTVLGAMLRHPVLVVVCLAIGILGGLVFAAVQPRHPVASALLVVRDPHVTGVGPDGSVTSRYTADQANILRSPSVARGASILLGRGRPPVRLTQSQVMSALTVTSSDTNNTLKLRFSAGSKAKAVAGANAVIQAYESSVAQALHQETAAELAAIDAALANLKSSGRQTNAQVQTQTQLAQSQLLAQRAQLVVLDANPTPGIAASSQPHLTVPTIRSAAVRDVGFGLVLGLLGAALLCYLIAARRRYLVDASDAGEVLGAPVIATFNSDPKAQTSSVARAAAAASLDGLCRTTGARVVSVIAADAHVNALRVASALAAGYGTTGRDALAIDFTRPVDGRREVAVDGSTITSPASITMRTISEQLATEGYDVILVAMSDFRAPGADIEILTRMDAAVLVVRRGQRSREVTELADGLSNLRVPLLGCVFMKSYRFESDDAPVPMPSTAPDGRVVSEAG